LTAMGSPRVCFPTKQVPLSLELSINAASRVPSLELGVPNHTASLPLWRGGVDGKEWVGVCAAFR
jgi:hypothetical protein